MRVSISVCPRGSVPPHRGSLIWVRWKPPQHPGLLSSVSRQGGRGWVAGGKSPAQWPSAEVTDPGCSPGLPDTRVRVLVERETRRAEK